MEIGPEELALTEPSSSSSSAPPNSASTSGGSSSGSRLMVLINTIYWRMGRTMTFARSLRLASSMAQSQQRSSMRGSCSLSCGQIFEHAWTEGCLAVHRVSRKLSFHHAMDSSKYCDKPSCISFLTNSWSTFRGCFGKKDHPWRCTKICHPIFNSINGSL